MQCSCPEQELFPPPQLLPLLPILPGVRLGPPPSLLDSLELGLPLIGHFGRLGAQAHEKLRASKLLSQTHSRPCAGVGGTQGADLGDFGGRQVVFLLHDGAKGRG